MANPDQSSKEKPEKPEPSNETPRPPLLDRLWERLRTKRQKVRQEDPNIYPLFRSAGPAPTRYGHPEVSSPSGVPLLHPHAGSRRPEHWVSSGPPHTTSKYGSDRSGSRVCQFNSLGFRSEELDTHARRRIFVCGCSYTFCGTGLNFEETWPYRLKQKYAQAEGCDERDVNLLNFSEGGASNDYIARTLLAQCSAVKPDLVVALFTFMNRGEGFADTGPYSVGPWMWRGPLSRAWSYRLLVGSRRRAIFRRLRHAERYYAYYSDELGFLNTLKDILLVQYYCQANNLKCLLGWVQYTCLSDSRFLEIPAFSQLASLIDRRHFYPFSIRDGDINVDLAADDAHPGPKSQEIFTSRLMDHLVGSQACA